VAQGAAIVLGAVILVAGVIAAIVSWSRGLFAVRYFPAVAAIVLVLGAIRLVNGFPALMAGLSTSQPLQLQLLVLIASGGVGLLLQSGAMGLVSGVVPVWCRDREGARKALGLGVALGVLAAAVRLASTVPGAGAMWPSYNGAATFVPFLAAVIDPLSAVVARIVFLAFLVAAANRLTSDWTRRRALVGAGLVIVGAILGNAASPLNLATWAAFAAAIGVVFCAAYALVLRHDVSIVPIAAATMTGLGALREGLAGAYPAALAGSAVAVVAMSLMAWLWFRALTPPAGSAPVNLGSDAL
jgi:hypothetical protein